MKKLKTLTVLILVAIAASGQVSDYTLSNCVVKFNNSEPFNYIFNINTTSLSPKENVLANGDGNLSTADSLSGEGFPIGFKFKYDGEYFDRFAVSTNNYIKLGKSSEGKFTIYNERSKGSVFEDGNNELRRNTISLFQRTLSEDTINRWGGVTSELWGYPGNRNLDIRWTEGSPSRAIYLRLFEKTGQIMVNYRMDTMVYSSCIPTGIPPDYYDCVLGDLSFVQASVGLRGNQLNNNMENLNIMKVTMGQNTWETVERGTKQTDYCDIEEHFMPPYSSINIYNMLDTIDCKYFFKWTPPSAPKTKPESPYVYFVYQDLEYLNNNGYSLKKVLEDDGSGNGYGQKNLGSDYYLFANGAKAILLNDATLHWNKAIGVDSFDVYLGLTYPPALVASNITDTTYTPEASLAPGTTYYYSIVAKNSEGNSAKFIGSFTTSDMPVSDCIPSYTSSCDCYDFSFNTLIYKSDANYADIFLIPETAYTTSVQREKTYTYSTTIYTSKFPVPTGMTPYVYFDWNQDGDFTDSNEKFAPGTITIPNDAKLGKTYMRNYWRDVTAFTADHPCGIVGGRPKQQYVINILPSEECSGLQLDYIKTNTQCYGDSSGVISLSPSGGAQPYKYIWTDGDTTQVRTGLPTGIYQATVTDSVGCDQITPVLAMQSPFLIQIDTATVNDTLTITILGGTGTNYECSWYNNSGVQVDTTSTGLPEAGTYTLQISDSVGCTVSYEGIVVPDKTTNALPQIKYASKTLQVYPNPTQAQVTVSSKHKIEKLQIVDMSGKIVFNKSYIAEAQITENISRLPTGIYLVKAYTENGIETGQIIKQ